jgi:hypothetical protein
MRYLSAFESALRRYGVPDWRDISDELRTQIAEGEASGRTFPLQSVGLGAPDALARAYAVELLMHPPRDVRMATAARFLKLAGLVAGGGFLSLVAIVTLGGLALSMAMAGTILIGGGALEAAGIHPSWLSTGNLAPWAVIALGPVALAIAWAMFWCLRAYLRAAGSALRRALPSPRT